VTKNKVGGEVIEENMERVGMDIRETLHKKYRKMEEDL
jgi:hypothetical protein